MPIQSERHLDTGDPAPFFNLPATDGKLYAPADFHGHDALVIVFTCNDCPFAEAKIEPLNELAERYDDVGVVGLNPNDAVKNPEDSYDRMKELVDDGTIRYDAYLRDEPQDAARSYGAVCTPDPFLFRFDEKRGEFRLAYHGRVDDASQPGDEPTTHDLREAIDAVLAGDAVEDPFLPSQGSAIEWKVTGEYSREG